MGVKRKFSANEWQILKECAAGRMTLQEAADVLGVTRERIRQIVAACFSGKRRKVSQNKKEQARQKLREILPRIEGRQMFLREIAAELGHVSLGFARQLMQEEGIDLSRYRRRRLYAAVSQSEFVISNDHIDLYLTGELRQKDLARIYRCSKPTIQYCLLRQGIFLRQTCHQRLVLTEEQIERLKSRAVTIVELADELSKTSLTILNALRRQGISLSNGTGR